MRMPFARLTWVTWSHKVSIPFVLCGWVLSSANSRLLSCGGAAFRFELSFSASKGFLGALHIVCMLPEEHGVSASRADQNLSSRHGGCSSGEAAVRLDESLAASLAMAARLPLSATNLEIRRR